MTFKHARSDMLDLFLTLQRDLLGRDSWESTVLPRPISPEMDLFREGCESWAPITRNNIPHWLAAANAPCDLPALVDDERLRHGSELIAATMASAAPTLTPAVAGYDAIRARAVAELDEILVPDRYVGPLCAALGSAETTHPLDLHLVAFAPHPPAAGFLADRGRLTGLYVDCRRFRTSTLADGVLTLLG